MNLQVVQNPVSCRCAAYRVFQCGKFLSYYYYLTKNAMRQVRATLVRAWTKQIRTGTGVKYRPKYQKKYGKDQDK